MSFRHTERTPAAVLEVLEEVFKNRYYLLEVARSIVQNKETAEDILHEACMRIMDASKHEDVKNLRPYCRKVVKNLAIDHYRRGKVEASCINYEVDYELLSAQSTNCPYKSLFIKETFDEINEVLSKLPEKTQQIFILYRLEGMTQREIARRLDYSLGSVNEHICAADAALMPCKRAFCLDAADGGESDA